MNLLAARDDNGRWSLSGSCDVEPAVCGTHEHDLVAIAIFVAAGDPATLRAALLAYGYETAQLDDDLSRRLLAWTLVHAFGNVAAVLHPLPAPHAVTSPALSDSGFVITASDGAD